MGVALLLLAACGAPAGRQTPDDDALVRLTDDEVKSLDPQKASDLTSLRVAADQFEGLTRYRGDGSIEPGLATGWTQSADGLIWRFPLRPGLRFSNGRPIDAGVFQSVFSRLHDPATASPHAGLFRVIAQMEAENAGQVMIRLRHPFPALPELLAHPAIAALPTVRIAAMGDHWTSERPLATSGPYRLRSWALHDRIVLERNPAWHDPPAPAPLVEWQPVDDRQAAFRRFRAGEPDLVGDFPSESKGWLDRALPGTAQVFPYRGSYYFVFNTRRPPFNDVRVRRALNMAAEREAIATRLLGVGNQPAWGVVPPGLYRNHMAYHPAWAGWSHERRIGEARRLLAQAGYSQSQPLRFEIRFNSDVDHRRVALALMDNWRALPVRPSLLNTEATLHFASMRRGDFDMARAGWIGDISAPENFLGIFQGNAGAINYPGFSNARFDMLLDRALALAPPKERDQAMARAEAALMDQAPVLPLYYYVTKNLVGPRVNGWTNNIANVHPSRTLGLRRGGKRQ